MVRRNVLRVSTALVVVLSAGVVLVVVGPSATATQGQPVIAGQTNTATSYTEVTSTQPGVAALVGVNTGSTSTGVQGNGSSYGIRGIGPTGVYATGTAGNGVWGETNSFGTSGVYGENDGTGYGVAGRAAAGTGVLADSANGTALEVTGRTKFSTAGTAVIASGQKKVTVTLAGVSTSDFVLATVQVTGSFYVKNATAGSGQFTITINKAPTAPATVKVAYFVISAS
jgi:hypothetical protein